MAAYRLLRPDPRNLGIGHNRIRAKTDKVDRKFSIIKDHVPLRRTFGNYRIVILNRERWGKTGPINWGKCVSGLQMEPVIIKRLGQEFANTKANYRGTFQGPVLIDNWADFFLWSKTSSVNVLATQLHSFGPRAANVFFTLSAHKHNFLSWLVSHFHSVRGLTIKFATKFQKKKNCILYLVRVYSDMIPFKIPPTHIYKLKRLSSPRVEKLWKILDWNCLQDTHDSFSSPFTEIRWRPLMTFINFRNKKFKKAKFRRVWGVFQECDWIFGKKLEIIQQSKTARCYGTSSSHISSRWVACVIFSKFLENI